MHPLEPVLVVNLFQPERQTLLHLLAELDDDDWQKPTICPGWTVKDIVMHMLSDDLGLLSRKRDGYNPFVVEGDVSWNDLVAFINAYNGIWVQAMRRVSGRLAMTLLAITGEEFSRYMHSLDPYTPGEPVSWAGPDPAPVWLDVAREYTERWVHQQHIRDALGRPGLKERHFFAPVLDTFARALPYTFRTVDAPQNTQVLLRISGEAGGEWSLRRGPERWVLEQPSDRPANALVILDQETAWRLFTKGITKEQALQTWFFQGDEQLARKVLDTVSIIA